jgi:hypothetical protein
MARGVNSNARNVSSHANMLPMSSKANRKKVRQKRLTTTICRDRWDFGGRGNRGAGLVASKRSEALGNGVRTQKR